MNIIHPRYRKTTLQHEADRAIAKATANADTTTYTDSKGPRTIGPRTPAGDTQRLRGIPAIGRGVAGHIPGTNPGALE